MTRQILGSTAWDRSGYITEDKREPICYCTGYCTCGRKQTMTLDDIKAFNKNCTGIIINAPSAGRRRLQRMFFFLRNLSRLKLVVNVDKDNKMLENHKKALTLNSGRDTI